MIEAIGVYRIESRQPCHLVELQITDSGVPLEIEKITQPVGNDSPENWQSPYKEYLLDFEGTSLLSEEWEMIDPERLTGSFRLAFFFHYLDMHRPLRTQFGDIELPKESEMPTRLKVLQYSDPD